MHEFVSWYLACASGCRACTGPNNSDCLACEDETLYRVTTDQPTMVCVSADRCDNPIINTFGDQTCGKPSSLCNIFY